jgi:hypothetical protein
MRNSRYWILFLICALGWLVASLLIAPSISGTDVFIFRDAGWNLAASGSFETAGGPYSHDLLARFYAFYTPIVPLLFAGYASVFPRNAYAGTIFNLLLGLSAAGVALWWVLRQPASRLRNVTACAVAVLAPVFTTYDRPEVVALILLGAVIALADEPSQRPVVAGLLIALTFLAHPFAAVLASVWTFALYLSHNWNRPRRFLLTLKQSAIVTVPVVAVLASVALLYYSIDRDSIARFAANALGAHSGVGMALRFRSGHEFVDALRESVSGYPIMAKAAYFLSLLSCCLLAAWSVLYRKQLGHAEWLAIAAGLACPLLAVILVPYQVNYVTFMAFSVPLGLLICSRCGGRLATPALAMMLFAISFNAPSLAISLITRIEQMSSFVVAREQPAWLRAQLASPNAEVVLVGDFYDFIKPEFRRLVELDYVEDVENHVADVAAVVNCYDNYHGDSGAVRPLPEELNASEFHLIQPAPQHLWITFFGHRVMHGEWGYGCDLYLRNSVPPLQSPH